MVQHIYTNIERTLINKCFVSNCFQPSKGVRQGCPLSPNLNLFILSAKILSNKTRQDSDVKGIEVFENEIKLSQFADDITLFNADLVIVEKAMEIVSEFGKCAGLSLNAKKTKASWYPF